MSSVGKNKRKSLMKVFKRILCLELKKLEDVRYRTSAFARFLKK